MHLVAVPVQEAPRTQVRALPPNMDPRQNCLDLGPLDLDRRGGGGVGVNVVGVRGNPGRNRPGWAGLLSGGGGVGVSVDVLGSNPLLPCCIELWFVEYGFECESGMKKGQ